MAVPTANIASEQEWLAYRLKEDDPTHIGAVQALALLLEDRATPFETARSITTWYEPSVKALPAERDPIELFSNDVCDFWLCYLSLAIRSLSDVGAQERFINLLIEITKCPDVLDDSGHPITGYAPAGDGIFWSGLPGWCRTFVMEGLSNQSLFSFLEQLLTIFTGIRYAEDFNDRDKYLAYIPGCLNATRFAATLLAGPLNIEGLPFEAASALEIGLEHSYDENSQHPEMEGDLRDDWPLLLPAAAIWLLVAGKQIYERCLSGDPRNGWEKTKFHREKWDLWKKNLAEFTKRDDFSEQCREFAAETVVKMLEIEEEYKG